MICCSFVFEPGEYDQEFYELDADIDKHARSLAGFIKTERWQSKNGVFVNSMYFFENEESVRELAMYPQHKVAKKNYARWYKSFRVDVMELSASYKSNPAPELERD